MESQSLEEIGARLSDAADAFSAWLSADVLAGPVLAQSAVAGLVILAAVLGGRAIRRYAEPVILDRIGPGMLARVARIGARVVPWLLALGVLAVAAVPFRRAGFEPVVIDTAAMLVVAWIAIRTLARLIANAALARMTALVVFAVIALQIVGLLGPIADWMDGLALDVGEIRLSALGIIKGLVLLVVLLWLARFVGALVESRLQRTSAFGPAMQVLAIKVVRIGLIVFAIVAALSAVGVELTAFAVFSGAIGVGLGFGLQKVVSNLISGFILLLDRSIKPGDVIETEGTYGAITKLHARYVSIVTRDNTEYLIPNEDLITNRVINWSFSNDLVRLRQPIGISYDSDVRKAMALCLEAAGVVERVVDRPAPRCLLRGFGDSSVDLELRFWIRDPANGTKNVTSDVLLGVWDRFRENGIQIPFPQRDLHLKSTAEPLSVQVVGRADGA